MRIRWTRAASTIERPTYCDICGDDLVQRTRNQIALLRGVI